MSGTDASDNIIKVNVAMHAFLHKCLFEEYGHWQDEIAWKALSGQIENAEINNEIRRKRMIGNKLFSGKTHTEEVRKRIGTKKGIKFTDEHKQKLSEARRNRGPTKEETLEKLRKPKSEKRKKYEITHPDGTKEIIIGLYKFMEKYDLKNLPKVLSGEREHCKGFTCKRIEE